MTSYPDFLCVGAQKAATTWLYEAIRWVPGVFLPTIKELHYFSELYNEDASKFGPVHRKEQIRQIRAYHTSKTKRSDFVNLILAQLDHLDTIEINDEWYRGIFEFATDRDICGEICPCYMGMPTRGIRHALSINPLMRVVVLVRDPVDRVWSHMRMHAKSGTLNLSNEHLLSDQAQLGPYMQYTDYANSFRRWQSMTAQGRFRAIVYDRISDEPQSVRDEILEFIGAPPAPINTNLTKRVFSGENVDLTPELRAKLFAELQPQYEFLQTLFPDNVKAWIQRHQRAINEGLVTSASVTR
jgi:Sulfotransferase family